MHWKHATTSTFGLAVEGSATLRIVLFAALALVGTAVEKPRAQTVPINKGTETTQPFELQVVGPDGKPVPEAMVVFRTPLAPVPKPIERGEMARPGAYGMTVKADGEGRLVVLLPAQPQRFVLMIQHPGYGPYWAAWESHGQPIRVPPKFVAELDAGWSVGGVVVDGDGNPVEGATVHPSIKFKKRPGDTSELHLGDEMKTVADGKWRFHCVPDSMRDVHVTINHPDYMPGRHSLARSEFGIELGGEPARAIQLKRGVMITGTVTDESGNPIADAVVYSQFLNEDREAVTGDDGTYFMGGCEPRMARIVVRAKGRALDMKQVRVEPGMEPVDFALKPGGKIRVRVVDENDKPLPRARIFFQRWRGHIDYFEFDHVNQYTDANGVWEWNEAPLDEFKADICPPGGMQLEEQPLVAREEEHVFRRVPLLVISGKVVDADTNQPVDSFRVVPGSRWDDSRLFWSQDEGFDAADGNYRITRNRGNLAHLVRVEASGYKAAVSREIKPDEGNVTIDFQLEKAENIAPLILTPDGAPADGAKIAIGVAGSQINIENGDIDNGSTYAAQLTADDGGRISFPPQDTPFQLVITHAAGFAHLKSAEAEIPETITLTPWARVEGVFRVGSQPVSGARLDINSSTIHSYGDDVPRIFTQHEATTGAGGVFVFDRVLPGDARIGRRIVYMVDDGATEVSSSKMVPIELAAGETTRIDLGGDGRAVVGKLAPPPGHTEKVLWSFARVQVQIDSKLPKSPEPPADVQNDREQYQAWWKQWSTTDEGKAWHEAYKTHERERVVTPYFYASAGRDGTFRIDDVPAGDYVLSVTMHEHPIGRLSNHRFTVPAAEADQADQPVDLGVLTLDKPSSPH
jgi:uncharacterized GH25 family protein